MEDQQKPSPIAASGFFAPDAKYTDQVLETLRQKWSQDRKCPICGSEAWRVQQEFKLSADRHMNPDGSGSYLAVQLVPVMCGECGYTFFVNPLKMTYLTRLTVRVPDGGDE